MQINILDYLDRAAALHPDKPAFCGDKSALTFAELNSRSRALGTALARAGVLRRPVAVTVGRDPETVLFFMSALHAGGFYVPVDPTLPDERLSAMLSPVSPAAFVCRPSELERMRHLFPDTPLFTEESAADLCDDRLLGSVRASIIDADPAYMIFTSGSTGTPKGIVVTHRGVIDLAEWLVDTFGFSERDVLGNQTPFYFDASVKDIYITFKCCATTHILSKKLFMFPSRLVDALNEKEVTSVLWATSAVNLLAGSGIFESKKPLHINRVFFAGEAMTGKPLRIWQEALPGATFVNLYGPTEITVDCTYYVVPRIFADDEQVPIGRACRNMEVLLLGEDGKPVPRGELGEICVRGSGVALGYYGDSERSAAVFVQNPLNPFWRDILYRTGDLARENEEGDLVFAARSDDQIKRHGNRIEPGDIEAAARSLDGISEALCLYNRERDRLVLALAGKPDGNAALMRSLSAKLPKYMLPDEIRCFDSFPHNANGKIDRHALKRIIDEQADQV